MSEHDGRYSRPRQRTMDSRRKAKVGDRFGRLVVLTYGGQDRHMKTLFWCQCDCDEVRLVQQANLRKGTTTSCGCWKLENQANIKTTHGATKGSTQGGKPTVEYRAWCEMKARCFNPNHKNADRYSERGITVAPIFLEDYRAFLAEVGPRPPDKTSIDRIDNDKGYEPGNLRWATQLEQVRNSTVAKLTMEDARMIRSLRYKRTQASLAKTFGVGPSTISSILRGGTWRE